MYVRSVRRGSLESAFHIFVVVDCSFAKRCWLSSHVGYYRGSHNCLAGWFLAALGRGKDEDHAFIVMIIWKLSNSRNDIVWNGKSGSATVLVQTAMLYYQLWKLAQETFLVGRVSSSSELPVKWSKPVEGLLKCNVDAGVFESSQKMGAGMVVMDHRGQFIAVRIC